MNQSHRPDVDVAQLLPRTAVTLDDPPRARDDRIEFPLDSAAATGRVTDRTTVRADLADRETVRRRLRTAASASPSPDAVSRILAEAGVP
jgi:hypothetical protein